MDNSQLAKLRSELVKGTNQAQKNIMLPADVKALLLSASKLVSELTQREIDRNGKGE